MIEGMHAWTNGWGRKSFQNINLIMSCPCLKPLETSSKSWLSHMVSIIGLLLPHSLIISHFAPCTLCSRHSDLFPGPWPCHTLSFPSFPPSLPPSLTLVLSPNPNKNWRGKHFPGCFWQPTCKCKWITKRSKLRKANKKTRHIFKCIQLLGQLCFVKFLCAALMWI